MLRLYQSVIAHRNMLKVMFIVAAMAAMTLGILADDDSFDP